MIQIPDDAVTVTDDTVRISLKNVAVVDQLTFPNAGGINLGNSGFPATLSFDITYQRSGPAYHVRPTSSDPLSPFNWAGEISPAKNYGTFSVVYMYGSFSAQGSFSSQGNFGEIGRERNGSFVRQGEQAAAALQLPVQASTPEAGVQLSASATQSANSPKFKGKVPVEAFVH
jgi:hypothetical protein